MKKTKATRRFVPLRLLAALLLLCQLLCAVSCGRDKAPEATTEAATEGDTPMDNTPAELIPLATGELLMEGTTLRTNYAHEDPTFDFASRIRVELGATWRLSSDREGANPIEGTRVTLEKGENVFYVTVQFRKDSRTYEAKINYRPAYTVEFFSAGSAVPTQTVDKTALLNQPADPTREGYTFLGWYLDGEKFNFTNAPTKSCVLIAHWKKNSDDFSASDTSVSTFQGINASLHAVWKDYADCNGLRPDSVTCVLTQRYGSVKLEHEILLTKNGATWKNPETAPNGAVLTQGAGGDWTLFVSSLPEKAEGRFCSYSLSQMPLSGSYSTQQVGASAVNTVKQYLPAADQSAQLTTRNSRLYDAAGNLVTLKGVVTLNVGIRGGETSMSYTALERLKETGCNAIRLTAQLIGTAEGSGYVYFNNGSARTGDYNDSNATRMTQKGKDMMIESIEKIAKDATELGLYLIIDWGILTSNPYQYLNEAKEFFGILAEKFADNPYLLFEICNEPKSTWGTQNGVENSIKAYAEELIRTIRSKGSNAVIIVAPNNSATALSAFSGTAVAGDDPIDDPIDQDLAYNVAYTFHCYPYNYTYTTYSWKLRDAYQAGLTVITTEMSPMDGTFDSPDTLSFDMEEAAKYMRMYQEWDMSFCYFRYHSYSSGPYNENHMFRPNLNLTIRQWTRDDLTECGKWYYDLVTGDGIFVRPDYNTIQKKNIRPNFNNTHTAYGIGNPFPGFAVSGSVKGNVTFFKVNDYDSLSDVLYQEYCKLIWSRIDKVDNGTAKTASGAAFNEQALPKSKTEAMEINYQYNGKAIQLTVSYGTEIEGGAYGILITVQ
ncbi:MAG: hypothetical protein E7620_07590 [Ruminococcaceae bacterium]|nr:hypothetical protein [Oscillospiraceae bacterium]